MRLGVRAKFLLASLALILVAGGVSALWLEADLRSWLEARIEGELSRYTRSLSVSLGRYQGEWTMSSLDAYAKELGEASGFRITIVDDDGTVLGDSQVAKAQVPAMDKHDTRPEILAAFDAGDGRARRYSHTIGLDMLYAASVVVREEERAVVRTAMSLKETHEMAERLRSFLFVAGALGFLVAVLLSGLAAHLISKALQELVDVAGELAEGRPSARLNSVRRDELGTLATHMDRLASQLQGQMERVVGARDRFAAVLEAIDAAVIALDERRRVTMVNATAERLLELPSDAIGRPLAELVRVPGLHALLDDVELVPGGFEELELGGESPRFVQARVAPFRASEGAVLVLHDISRIRHLEAVRRDFVANVSHELRTPLSIILANTEMLLDGALDDEQAARTFLSSMHRSARRLSALVSDLLDLSRLESDEREGKVEPVMLEPVVAAVLEEVASIASENRISFDTETSEDCCVLADANGLEQVLLNLVANAIKYSGQGSLVSIRAAARGRRLRVEVSDNGPGVPEAHRSRLFERFYRVDAGRSRAQGGTGLGLAIVKHLVNAMDGEVGVETSASGGALFWFELPQG